VEVKLDKEQFEPFLRHAILQSIDQQTKERLISDSVKSLIAPGKSSYGRQEKSPLEAAFDQACFETLRNVAREIVQSEEVKKNLRDLATKVFDKMWSNETLVEKVSNSLADSLSQLLMERAN
jgi:hypothetical protein